MPAPAAAVSIGDSVQQTLDSIFGFIPNLIGALVLLFVGYVIARVLKGVVTKVLDRVGLDAALRKSPAGPQIERLSSDARASKLLGAGVFWIVLLGAISLAVSALSISALTAVVAEIYAYLPNVIVAVLILAAAVVLAGFVARLVGKLMGDTPTGKIVSSVAPALIMVIAAFMILNQLMIAPEIVTITYAALLGSIALGMALAFGLGGRDAAATLISGAYEKAREDEGPGDDGAAAAAPRSERFKRDKPGDGAPYSETVPHHN